MQSIAQGNSFLDGYPLIIQFSTVKANIFSAKRVILIAIAFDKARAYFLVFWQIDHQNP